MGDVVAIEAVTLDGVMQGMGGPDEDRRNGFAHGGWAAGRGDAAMGEMLSSYMTDPSPQRP